MAIAFCSPTFVFVGTQNVTRRRPFVKYFLKALFGDCAHVPVVRGSSVFTAGMRSCAYCVGRAKCNAGGLMPTFRSMKSRTDFHWAGCYGTSQGSASQSVLPHKSVLGRYMWADLECSLQGVTRSGLFVSLAQSAPRTCFLARQLACGWFEGFRQRLSWDRTNIPPARSVNDTLGNKN